MPSANLSVTDFAEQVKVHRLGAIAALYGVHQEHNRAAQLLGTGTYVKQNDEIYILTARHVMMNGEENFWGVMHGAAANAMEGDRVQMEPCPAWNATNESFDLAVVACLTEKSIGKIRPIEIADSISPSIPINDTAVLACGWPKLMAFPEPFLWQYHTRLHSTSGLVHSRASVKSHSFAFDCAELEDYEGMSGAAVWNLTQDSDSKPAAWTPSMSQLVGIVTRWSQTESYLVATGAKAITTYLPQGINAARESFARVKERAAKEDESKSD